MKTAARPALRCTRQSAAEQDARRKRDRVIDGAARLVGHGEVPNAYRALVKMGCTSDEAMKWRTLVDTHLRKIGSVFVDQRAGNVSKVGTKSPDAPHATARSRID